MSVDTDEMDEIYDESPQHKNYSQMPHMVLTTPGLSHAAIHLYWWYKMVCGERPGGRCWMSMDAISDLCRMSRHTLQSAREQLASAGLIIITSKKSKAGYVYHIVGIRDIWKKNAEWKFPEPTADVEEPPKNSSVQSKHSANDCTCDSSVQSVRDLSAVCTGPQCSSHTQTICNEQEGKNNTHTEAPQKDAIRESAYQGEGFSLNEKDQQPKEPTYTMLVAMKLHEALAAKRRIKRPPNMHQWAELIRKFMIQSSVTREDIDPVLDWYINNLDEKFTPQADSARSFIEKFDRIEQAMRRSKQETNGHNRINGIQPGADAFALVREELRNGRAK